MDTDWIAPGNASATVVTNFSPSLISKRTWPSSTVVAILNRSWIIQRKRGRISGLQHHHIAADFAAQLRRRAQANNFSQVQDGQPVAAFSLFHQVRGHDDGNFFLCPQFVQVEPQVATRAGIKTGGRFIQQQHARPMHQPFGQLHAALHPAGKSFHAIFGAVGQSNALQHLLNACR